MRRRFIRSYRLAQRVARMQAASHALVISALGVAAPILLGAQGAPAEPPGCSGAVKEVRARRSNESVVHGLGGLLECPQTGPLALVTVWAIPPSDPAVLNTLSHASAGIRDMRVLTAVMKSAEDATLFRTGRQTALRTLVRLYHPTLEVDFKTRPEDGANGPVFVMMGKWTSTPGREGAVPITESGKDEILATLDRVGQTGTDQELRRVALRLKRELGSGS
jgi:hypothetical protein